MTLPEDAREFRDISLLHDSALSPTKRQELLSRISIKMISTHEIFVQTLLGSAYHMPTIVVNRAKTNR